MIRGVKTCGREPGTTEGIVNETTVVATRFLESGLSAFLTRAVRNGDTCKDFKHGLRRTLCS